MTKLSKHSDKNVSEKAQALIEKWKNIVLNKQQIDNSKQEGSSNDESIATNDNQISVRNKLIKAGDGWDDGINSVEEDKTQPHETINSQNSIDNCARSEVNMMTDEEMQEFIAESKIKDPIRNNIRDAITKALLKIDNNKLKIQVISTKIETQLIKEYSLDKCEYTNRSRTLIANLMRSEDFKRKVFRGVYTPEEVATLDPKEMLDEKVKKKKAEMEKEIIDSKRSDYMLANMKIKEGMYTCSKCKSKKTTFYEQQTRSADEPMTTFVTCLDCGHHMKF